MGSVTLTGISTPFSTSYGTSQKPINQMTDEEFAAYASGQQTNQNRTNQLNTIAGSGVSAVQLQAQQQAKDLAQTQLDNSDKQMALSSKYRSAESEQNNQITQQQNTQKYGIQTGLNTQENTQQTAMQNNQNTQQTAMQNNQNTQQTNMFNLQNQAKQQDTQSARNAASSLYFGRARNGSGFQGRG